MHWVHIQAIVESCGVDTRDGSSIQGSSNLIASTSTPWSLHFGVYSNTKIKETQQSDIITLNGLIPCAPSPRNILAT